MEKNEKWLEWAIKIQAIAQTGLYYGRDKFDLQRYEELREIAAEMISYKSEIPLDKVKDLFCNESGYQTPKLEMRAAVIKEDKILLIKENNGTWSLPGGWVDVDVSVKENTIKEVKEESGLDVSVDLLVAVQERDKHNGPIYPFKICKLLLLCTELGGEFVANIETLDSGYFTIDNLPHPLATEKITVDQIKLCFAAYYAENWKTIVD